VGANQGIVTDAPSSCLCNWEHDALTWFVDWLMDLTFGGRMLDELASMSTDS